MSDVPLEILAQILSRLAVKPLLQFRCVSKQWCALIDSPYFIKLHLNRSIETNSNRSIIVTDTSLYSVDLDSLENVIELNHPAELGTEILGSCNGLLCLYNSEEDIVLWNPSTRNYHKLPMTEIEFPVEEGVGFINQRNLMFFAYGFGYDHVNDDYKVVRMVQFYGANDKILYSEVKVYSLNLNSWRRIWDFPYYLNYFRAYGMLAGGALHWIVKRNSESDSDDLIVAFDIGTEEYRLVPPPEYADKNFHMHLEVLEGCLCVIFYLYSPNIDIWVMKNYGVKESWTKLISIAEFDDLFSCFEVARPLAYSKSGEQVLLDPDGRRLIWYDLKRKTVKNVSVCGMPNFFETNVFWGSLVQLNSGGGTSIRDMVEE